MVEDRGSPLVSQPSALGRKRSSSPSRRATASSPSSRSVVSTDGLAVERAREHRGVDARVGQQIHLAGAVGAGDDDAVGERGERQLELRGALDRRLSVVRVQDHGIALEEASAPPAASSSAWIAASVRASATSSAPLGPVRVRGVVEVGEVVREEVEAVARDEPAPDGGGVRVDRAGRRGCARRTARPSGRTRRGCRRRTASARTRASSPTAASADASCGPGST